MPGRIDLLMICQQLQQKFCIIVKCSLLGCHLYFVTCAHTQVQLSGWQEISKDKLFISNVKDNKNWVLHSDVLLFSMSFILFVDKISYTSTCSSFIINKGTLFMFSDKKRYINLFLPFWLGSFAFSQFRMFNVINLC